MHPETDKVRRFAELHRQSDILILPNAWDAASARLFEIAGFPAIGTTSGGIAFTLGYPDGEQAPWPEHLAVIRNVSRCVNVPVTADIESGYGDLTRVVQDLIAAGVVGVNLEDAHPGQGHADPLFGLEEQVERVRLVKQTGLFVNARTDTFLLEVGHPELRLQFAIERVKAFVAAGADCVFVPGLREPGMISEIVLAAGAPVNILGGVGVPSPQELTALGVKRVSVGSGPMRSAMGHTRRVAEDLRTGIGYGLMVNGAVSYADANGLFTWAE